MDCSIIQSKKVWIDEHFIPAQVEICDDKIIGIYPYGEKTVTNDYGNFQIVPGFIDVHDHGYLGGDANRADTEFLQKWAAYLPQEGITRFLPTTSTAYLDALEHSYEVIGRFMETKYKGAQMVGIHLEGPMISVEKRGSHNPKLILKPDIEMFEKWQKISNNHIKMITIAPENDENYALTQHCAKRGIVVGIGHTAATYQQAKEAIEHGAKTFIHTFNGMSEFRHREPGASGAAMDLENAYAEIIADGVHVHFAVVRILAKAKGKDHLIAITDSIWAKDCKPGIYPKKDKGVNIIVDENNVVRLETGSLAGSTNKLNVMVKNLIQKVGLPEVYAINAVTSNPAKLLGLESKLGYIKENYLVDFTVLDENFDVRETWVAGHKVFGK